ncbi:type 1 glutamine amidotransferase domain-containing protein [Rhizosphaericola mali]|uniref:Type 1 glutamine amidotransferase domain-containing protein n=1 Tax=Rhizosphaericola mali TaxID=2545455 RepID=A0A5P2G0L2_9BACT|nr:type 1 glutamine amidotransferase domain-containing protein [Rhizosphaericola mali]QES88198.1 type 1 glutamine amidotransferase domain-containing protein [Rhizosphaericola mali]
MKIWSKLAFIGISLFFTYSLANAQRKNGKKKILFVVTSHGEKGNTGEKTGYFLGEVAHPWKVLTDAGYDIDFVSPKGGDAPVDGFNLKDSVNNEFWNNKKYHYKITHTLKPSEINPSKYSAIYYAGGHGAMWDLPNDTALARIAATIYQNNGIVAADCHGPAGLVNIKLADGSYLVNGKKINGFTDEEEKIVGLTNVVPFLLEDRLKERGGIYEKSAPWQIHVTEDQRVITGQNPQSAASVGEAIKNALKK